MADVYDTLSADNQAVVRLRLYDYVTANASSCASVDLSTITGADALTDQGNRALAIDCFQMGKGVGSAAGVLDTATYQSLMASAAHAPMSMGEKLALGAVAVLGAFWLLKGKRGRRGPRGRRG